MYKFLVEPLCLLLVPFPYLWTNLGDYIPALCIPPYISMMFQNNRWTILFHARGMSHINNLSTDGYISRLGIHLVHDLCLLLASMSTSAFVNKTTYPWRLYTRWLYHQSQQLQQLSWIGQTSHLFLLYWIIFHIDDHDGKN